MNSKRCLIELPIPLDGISEQSPREKVTQQGRIPGLHIWWAHIPWLLAVGRFLRRLRYHHFRRAPRLA